MAEQIVFIPNAGACMTTKNVTSGVAPVRWMDREPSRDGKVDNGWRIFSAADTSEYLEDTANWQVVDFNTVCNIEPALIGIWDLPIGSQLELRVADGRRSIVDSRTGRVIPEEALFVPSRPPR
ncbi:DUF2185 domain-containing protein [Blastococcus sp. Marseille-P5729]|uniref:DUF2185 domain-containing protein n=1 Tax=Blastococcus sp. Marseille-P5729 TaxID=2086582 RepID=UPI000D0F3A23|nr:DUF2185 domain-containing protein [Blastococcus sp. Marseille-P5729]